jgi:outer membrane protein
MPHPRNFFTGALVSVIAFTFVSLAAATPLTLDEAIRLALQKNPRVQVSAFSPQIARANVSAEFGHFEPSITFRRTYSENNLPVSSSPLVIQLTKEDDYALSFGGLTPWGLTYSLGATATNQRGTFNQFSDSFVTFGGLMVTQPLLRGGGFGANLANLRVAKANRGISDWDHRQTVIDTVTSVIFAYNNVLLARENLRIAQLSRNLAAQLLDENEKKFKVGSISDADVTQARARVAGREESILIASQSIRDVENQLRQLIGETSFPLDGPALELAPLPPATPLAGHSADDLKRAYDLRPDVQAARLGVTIKRSNDTVAHNQLLPQLDFVGSVGYNGLDPNFAASRRQVGGEDNRAYSVGMVVKVPLAFAEGRGRARAARLTLRQSEADLVRLERDIAISVTAAAGQIETTHRRVDATRTALDLAQQELTNEQKRFTAGTSSTFLVATAQQELSSAQISYALAVADERHAIASYERELGATLARHQVTIP